MLPKEPASHQKVEQNGFHERSIVNFLCKSTIAVITLMLFSGFYAS